jgi:hypothetical protein
MCYFLLLLLFINYLITFHLSYKLMCSFSSLPGSLHLMCPAVVLCCAALSSSNTFLQMLQCPDSSQPTVQR